MTGNSGSDEPLLPRHDTGSTGGLMTNGSSATTRIPAKLSLGKKVLLTFVPVLLLLVLGEIAARIFYSRPPAILVQAPLAGNVNLMVKDYFEFHPRLFWVLRPDLRQPLTFWGDTTNSRGFRTMSEPGDRRESVRILCLGDSSTYGLGLPVGHAWPAALDRRLACAEVVNAGVPGYSSYQGRILYEDRCEDLDSDALVVTFGLNDVLGWPTPHNGGMVGLHDHDRADHLSYTRTSSRLLQWIRSGLLVRPESIEMDVSEENWCPRVPISEFRDNLEHFGGLAPFVIFVVWPMRTTLDPECVQDFPLERLHRYQQVVHSMVEAGHSTLDVGELFRSTGLPPERLFRDLVHATSEGAEIVAQELARRLRERLPRLRTQ